MATWQDIITAAQTLLQRWKRDVDFTSQIVNGPATGPTSVVNTDGGTIPTFAKTLADAAAESQSLRSDIANTSDPLKGAALVGGLIANSVTLNVPAQHATIAAALSYLSGYTIARNATVTIQVADGTYAQGAVNYCAHPQGVRIRILGNTTTPTNCVIQCAASDAFYIPPGYKIGEIDGFSLQKTGAKANFGVLTDGGSVIKLGPKITVDNFYYGIAARNGGLINCPGTSALNRVAVSNAGDVGIWAFLGSYVNCEYASVTGSNDSANGLGGGIVAEFGSSILATSTVCTGNWLVGISALTGSSIRAWSCTATGNGNVAGQPSGGVFTGSMGSIEVFDGSTITGNTGYAHFSDGSGQIFGLDSATTTGNTLGVRRTPFRLTESGNNARFETGSVTNDGTTASSTTGGDAYDDMNASANKFIIRRALIAGVERGRLQYRDDFDLWELVANSRTLLRAFDTGKTTIGRGSPAVGDTTAVGVQIPRVTGQPTGTITDTEGGFVSLVYDTTNNKLWVYNGAWRGITLT